MNVPTAATLAYEMETHRILFEYDRIGKEWWDDNPEGMRSWSTARFQRMRRLPHRRDTSKERTSCNSTQNDYFPTAPSGRPNKPAAPSGASA